MPYCTESDVEAFLGYDIDSSGATRPSSTRLRRMLVRADELINAEMHVDNNILVERTKITCSAQTDLADGEYFHFYVTDYKGGEAEHYVWYDKTGSGSDPSKSGTAHEVDISSDTTARDVAASTATVIDAIDGVYSWSSGSYLYIENNEMYDATDTADGDTSFTFETLQDGSDDSGGLKNIALELVYFMINNMFALTDPAAYAPKDVELTKDHIRTIHKTYYYWSADTFDLDGR